jgi:acetoin utilization deacetylase AcuC-like enzyme
LPALSARAALIVISGVLMRIVTTISQLMWTDADYAWLTEQIVAVADRHARGRIVSTAEGGYDLITGAQRLGACARVRWA